MCRDGDLVGMSFCGFNMNPINFDCRHYLNHIVHEIGNPLNGMFTSIQVMERFLESRDPARDEIITSSLRDLKSEIIRLQRILSDARSPSENRTELKPTDLSGIIANVVRTQKSEFDVHRIGLVEKFSTALPPVLADHTKLQQALLNLIKNSVEAMPDGGTLSLRTFRRSQYVVIEVADTGVGMSRDVSALKKRGTTKAGGMGLGLCIVREIIAAHGGHITYDTEEGKGTRFRLFLVPVVTPEKQKLLRRITVLPPYRDRGSRRI